MKVYVSSGGGVRVGASFGAAMAGESLNTFKPADFDYFAGTSAGALDAALTANGWTAAQKQKMFLDTDFSNFFTPAMVPFVVRELAAAMLPISTRKLQAFYSSLCLPNPFGPALKFTENLFINTVDSADNIQVIYCQTIPDWAKTSRGADGKWYSPGGRIRWELCLDLPLAMVRSSALPGMVSDDLRYMDGGVAENPLLSIFPADADILLMMLGYPGDTNPKTLIKRLGFAYDFKAYTAAAAAMDMFPNIRAIQPRVFNVSSASFNINRRQKQAMIQAGFDNTLDQWKGFQNALDSTK